MSPLDQLPPHLVARARNAIERGRLGFFDFSRQVGFGFVAEERGGYFCQLRFSGKEPTSWDCPCPQGRSNQMCVHTLTLMLKSMRWPRMDGFVWETFEQHRLTTLLRTIPAPDLDLSQLIATHKPRLLELGIPERWLKFVANDPHPKAQRDRKAWEQARLAGRSDSERKMASKGFASASMQFEESDQYLLAKLLIELDEHEALECNFDPLPGHRAAIRFSLLGAPLLEWTESVAQLTRKLRAQLTDWRDAIRIPIQVQSLPITYAINFDDQGHLTIEPRVETADDRFQPLSALAIDQGHLHYHQELGYFGVQSGLSPFELEYARAGVHRVPREDVDVWLRTHRDGLETLDRRLIDDVLFEDVVVDGFDKLDLELLEISAGHCRVKLRVRLGKTSIDHAALARLASQSSRYLPLGGRLLDTLGLEMQVLKPLISDASEIEIGLDGLFRITAFFLAKVEVQTEPHVRDSWSELESATAASVPALEGSKLSLRPYQELGYRWLWFLKSYGLGGLLCDQMGLGKTHQAMALLHAAHSHSQDGLSLVVSPASVIYHWYDKLREFCPRLSVHLRHGSQRTKTLPQRGVLLTSYGTMRSDLELLRQHQYCVLIFDEIQAAKNADTQLHRSARALSASCRLGLTGTPIENHVDELKNIFDIVTPGLLGPNTEFRAFFSDPISKFGSKRAKARLHSIVQPFILRRSKREVLPELPEKTETCLSFDLSDYERDLYDRLQTEFKNQGKRTNYLSVFQLIDQLKRLCNHPALVLGEAHSPSMPSTKWRLFTHTLDQSLESGEKIVVFSQYLATISMICRQLDHLGIDYACLTGATRDRKQQMERFQNRPQCRVFVGSLLASGVGVDLTAGSTVIHYDRWWNAAREEQATDRVHRIGQQQPVQVYRFRARNTVEERIDEIIESKRHLLDDVVAFDPESLQKRLTLDQLLEILA